jgi:hypothetical protein
MVVFEGGSFDVTIAMAGQLKSEAITSAHSASECSSVSDIHRFHLSAPQAGQLTHCLFHFLAVQC